MENPLTPERWRRARAVFDRVVGLPAGERAAATDAACPGDAALAAEVRALLAADDAAGAGFLAGSAFELAPPAAFDEPARQQIGPYAVIRELG
ncbi:MAG TPA: hypothetical protein VNR90_09760, partial [Vicinamibacterales bacterium]|nr:hypothetical protein [Vicinamibacterales bacterium]